MLDCVKSQCWWSNPHIFTGYSYKSDSGCHGYHTSYTTCGFITGWTMTQSYTHRVGWLRNPQLTGGKHPAIFWAFKPSFWRCRISQPSAVGYTVSIQKIKKNVKDFWFPWESDLQMVSISVGVPPLIILDWHFPYFHHPAFLGWQKMNQETPT